MNENMQEGDQEGDGQDRPQIRVEDVRPAGDRGFTTEPQAIAETPAGDRGYLTESAIAEAPEPRNREVCVETVSDSTKIRGISIEQLHYGYIVKVGCHSFALEKHETVSAKIAQYLADPAGTEKLWFSQKLF